MSPQSLPWCWPAALAYPLLSSKAASAGDSPPATSSTAKVYDFGDVGWVDTVAMWRLTNCGPRCKDQFWPEEVVSSAAGCTPELMKAPCLDTAVLRQKDYLTYMIGPGRFAVYDAWKEAGMPLERLVASHFIDHLMLGSPFSSFAVIKSLGGRGVRLCAGAPGMDDGARRTSEAIAGATVERRRFRRCVDLMSLVAEVLKVAFIAYEGYQGGIERLLLERCFEDMPSWNATAHKELPSGWFACLREGCALLAQYSCHANKLTRVDPNHGNKMTDSAGRRLDLVVDHCRFAANTEFALDHFPRTAWRFQSYPGEQDYFKPIALSLQEGRVGAVVFGASALVDNSTGVVTLELALQMSSTDRCVHLQGGPHGMEAGLNSLSLPHSYLVAYLCKLRWLGCGADASATACPPQRQRAASVPAASWSHTGSFTLVRCDLPVGRWRPPATASAAAELDPRVSLEVSLEAERPGARMWSLPAFRLYPKALPVGAPSRRLAICTHPMWDMAHRGAELRDWLDYHLLVGVEHFFLSDLDGTLAGLLESYVRRGVVTYMQDWVDHFPAKFKRFMTGASSPGSFEKYALEEEYYSHCIWENRGSSRWLLFLHAMDCYVACDTPAQGFDLRRHVLRPLERRRNSIAALHILNIEFGGAVSSREDQDGGNETVLERWRFRKKYSEYDDRTFHFSPQFGTQRYFALRTGLLGNPEQLVALKSTHWGRGRPGTLHLDGAPCGLHIRHYVDVFRPRSWNPKGREGGDFDIYDDRVAWAAAALHRQRREPGRAATGD